MRGRTVEVTWQDELAALYARYREEREPELRTRWHALWLVRQGRTLRETARLVGVHERSLQQWIAWYRQGGLAEVARHRRGGRQGRPSYLTAAQWAEVIDRAKQGAFFTVHEAVEWVAERFGTRYRYGGMHAHLRRHKLKKKVPRPQGVKADPEAQAAWKQGGLSERLWRAGLWQDAQWAVADEMRLGLLGQVRRCWAPRGVKVRQRRQITYKWTYLALAVDGLAGRLWWQWLPNMKQESIKGLVEGWRAQGLEGLVWDGSGSHKAKVVRAVGLPLITLPTQSPELSPAERVFEEVRRIEGRVYADLAAKVTAAEAFLRKLAADPEAVRRLCGWAWIREAVLALPP